MSSQEPLAIVGMACRFPGGASRLDRFWQLLEKGVDAICDVPPSRWDSRKYFSPNPDKPGKAYVKQGGFLQESVDEFDPFFFRMSPREAESLDPQQRILLEVAWESIEDAGIPLAQLEGPQTGVFVGGFCLDANHLQLSPLNRESIDSHTATSSSMAMLANRVSYIFNLQGPSVTVDTACSSSLVATHLACQSLWNSECDIAIAGGTNVILLPETTVTMSKGKFLSVDGRCMTFDKRANGYVRGEGAGTVILKRLSQAQQDGDYIYAQIMATGINQDGRTSGITFPSGDSQKALMRRVYADAGIQPSEIDYIEAHGTGTQAGDVTEATALHEVLSEGRSPEQQVIVGSVKSNIGHLEAAAGVAGLIKTSMCLDRRQIVPNLHFHDPNPSIPFDTNCLTVPTAGEEWNRSNGQPRMAAINSFGYGGTNAHVLLQEAPAPRNADPSSSNGQATQETHRRKQLVCLSATGEAALREQARKYVNWLKDTSGNVPFRDIVYSMNQRRSHLDNRLAVFAHSADDLAAALRSWSREETPDGLTEGTVDAGPLTFVYTGMGPQWWAMGRQLFDTEPLFADTLKNCDQLFRDLSGWSVLEEILKDEQSSRINATEIAQPANLVMQVALTELWKSWGVVPQAIVGHSIGEVAAAWASGALTLEDALLVSLHRSRLQATTAGTGTMLAVGLSEQEVQKRILAINNGQTHLSIAAINSPTSVTLAGDQELLEACEKELQADGIFARFLTVEVPYHSHKMDPLRDELLSSLQSVTPRQTDIPLYSTVTGQIISGTELDNEYWWQNVRQTVRFADAAATLIADGNRHFLEVGPHPVLRPSLREALSHAGKKGHTFESLNRKESDECGTLQNSLGQLVTTGVSVDLDCWSDPNARYTKLPGYSWQKEKYWRESPASRQERFGLTGPSWFHQDLGLHSPAWEVELSPFYFPWVEDHVVQGNVVFPGAAYVEAGLEAHRKLTERTSCVIENISFLSMLAIAEDKAPRLQLHYDEGSRYYTIHSSLNEDHDRWALHARGKLVQQEITSLMETRSLDELKARCPTPLDPEQQYEALRLRGLEYGPAFRTITQWRRGDSQVLAELRLSAEMISLRDDSLLHPTILDGAFQSLVGLFDADGATGQSFVPVEIEKLLFYAPVGTHCWVHAELLHTTDTLIEGTIELIGASGELLVSLQGVQCKAIAGSSKLTDVNDCVYQTSWTEAPEITTDDSIDTSDEPWLVLADDTIAQPWSDQLNAAGVECITAWPLTTDELQTLFGDRNTLNVLYPWSCQDHSAGTPHEQLTTRLWPLNLLAQAAQLADLDTLRITAVTEPIQRISETETELLPDAGSLHGLLPLISNEYHNIQTWLIEADAQTSPQNILRDILVKSSESSIAWRDDRRFVKRLQHVTEESDDSEELRMVSTKDTNLELRISKPGSLDSLEFVEKERRAPGPGEIEIEVYASSLNFKDLLKVYGQIADNVIKDTYFGNSLGMELSGVVTRVGEGITEFKVGDDVAGPIRGSFCSYATVPTTYVIHRPKPLSFNQTPVYIGYLAAFRGLVHCAQLAEGEKILIHNATGGVGIAAVQIAKWKNAEIYATAGTKEKREYLRQQGIEHIYDSRSLLFVEQILRDTDGYGVDVVINAIAGEALYESFDILAPYGRFIEIGKKDIGDDNGLPMRAFNRNLTFTAVDMDRMLVDRVPIVQQILRDISDNFESGIFQPVPMAEFKASGAREAFAFMAQSKHMGKVVLEFKDDHVPLRTSEQEQQLLDPDGSYLITGGTAGFGLQVARWLADQGAGRLYLLSRSGIKSDEDRQVVEALQKQTEVVVRSLDVTDRDQVNALLSEIREGDRPLKGIVHGAMVLDDGFLADMTPDRWNRVLAPKVDGAWNLHHASRDDALDWFLMFSSVASVIGNPGQASYVAANSFLDSFAHYRRSLGLPATTINWGVLLEAGVVARNADVGDVLEASGMHGFTNRQAFDGLHRVLADQPVQAGLFDIDWSRVKSSFPMLASSAAFADLIEAEGSGSQNNREREALIEKLLPLSPDERQLEVEQRLLQTISSILRIPANRIGADKLIADLGIDSLVAVELTVALQKELGVELTTVDLLGMPTVSELATLLLNGLISDEDELLARLDELSEEELDQLLNENADLVSAQQQGNP